MEDLEVDETNTVIVGKANQGSRKRKKGTTTRECKITEKYLLDVANVFIPCNHSTKTLFCHKVRPNHVKKFREIYEKADKIEQDSIIASMIHTVPVKRRRPRIPSKDKKKKSGSEHKYSVLYYLTLDDETVRICKNIFLSVTKMGRTRLNNIIEHVYNGLPYEEKRGGDRKSHRSVLKKEGVRNFIKLLCGTESHYSRNKRIYLNADLNMRKLHKIYNDNSEEDLKVNFSMFHRIFINEFNIVFKSLPQICVAIAYY